MRALLPLLLILCGCAPTLPTTVEVPVPVPCPAPLPLSRPSLPVSDLTATSSPAAVIRAYAESLEALAGYCRELEVVLDGYRGAR